MPRGLAGWFAAPAETGRDPRPLWRGQAPRCRGHKPLGGWLILRQRAGLAALAVRGGALGSAAYWVDPPMTAVLQGLARRLTPRMALHRAGVVLMRRLHHKLRVLAVCTGRKRRAPVANAAELDC